ncbi:unnamed protein product [marine sediment metagenome]|uniref:Uncharacterized protein n=1 Tax=marine sediment metagenome TaxID=412755 RepID=X0X544_9ZZZZ
MPPNRTSPKETIETKGMTNRDIALDTRCRLGEIENHLATINGTVADLTQHRIDIDNEFYGNEDKHIVGVKPQTNDNRDDLATFKIAWKVAVTILGAGNLAAWITVLSRQ